jgi:hypothetical protein
MTFVGILMMWGAIQGSVAADAGARDGRWWLALEQEPRTEFIAGYASYYTWKLRGSGRFSATAETYRVTLEARLKAKPADLTVLMSTMLDEEAARTSSGTGWRGNFGGHYWGELGESGRIGFLQGALECQRRDEKSTSKFSRPHVWYAAEISRGYGMTAADPLGSDEALLGTSILDVLLRLQDNPSLSTLELHDEAAGEPHAAVSRGIPGIRVPGGTVDRHR